MENNENEPMHVSPKFRVRLYQLDFKQWVEQGTGYITLYSSNGASEDYDSFRVTCEETKKLLLDNHMLSDEESYELQGDSLIVWTDKNDFDLALSFQEREGCKVVWNGIRRFQGLEENAEQLMIQNKIEEEQPEVQTIPLPSVTLENLSLINKTVQQPYGASISKSLLETNYLSQLFKLFEVCEAKMDIENLHLLFEIMKNIILLNNRDIFEELFSEKHVMNLMGVLEYDPLNIIKKREGTNIDSDLDTSALYYNTTSLVDKNCTIQRKANHRHYLNNVVIFKKIVSFSSENDARVTEKIHEVFRIQYLKECILPRYLDDSTFTLLNVIVSNLHQEITETIYSDSKFLPELFEKLLSKELSNSDCLDLLTLLLEYNSLLSNTRIQDKMCCYEQLIRRGLFDVLTDTLHNEDRFIRQHSSELIATIITFNNSLARNYILDEYRSTKTSKFFKSFIRGIIDDTELGVQENLVEALRLLIDQDVWDIEGSTLFLEIFYEGEFLSMLLAPLLENEEAIREKMKSSKTKESSKQAMSHVLELLSDFVRLHRKQCRTAIIEKDVLLRVSRILKVRYQERDLVLCIIRFFRACMALSDEQLNKYIIDHELFSPILTVLKDNYLDNNMLSSAVIEMIEFMYLDSDRAESLIMYIGSQYSSELEMMKENIESIRSFLEKYNELQVAERRPQKNDHVLDPITESPISSSLSGLDAGEESSSSLSILSNNSSSVSLGDSLSDSRDSLAMKNIVQAPLEKPTVISFTSISDTFVESTEHELKIPDNELLIVNQHGDTNDENFKSQNGTSEVIQHNEKDIIIRYGNKINNNETHLHVEVNTNDISNNKNAVFETTTETEDRFSEKKEPENFKWNNTADDLSTIQDVDENIIGQKRKRSSEDVGSKRQRMNSSTETDT